MGERLKRLRKSLGMTQEEFAMHLSVPVGTLRSWERDRRRPQLRFAVDLARALGTTLEELVGGKLEPTTKK